MNKLKYFIGDNRSSSLRVVGRILLLILPVFLFVFQFGFKYSGEISAWINTVTYLNNIYTPILAIYGAVYIFKSFENQSNSNRITEHAVVYNFTKEQLEKIINIANQDIKNIQRNRLYANFHACEIQVYSSEYLQLLTTTFHWSDKLVKKLEAINQSLFKYRFIQSQYDLFDDQFESIIANLNICKIGYETLKFHKDVIEQMLPHFFLNYNVLDKDKLDLIEVKLDRIIGLMEKYRLEEL
jgi:hypothetical protein